MQSPTIHRLSTFEFDQDDSTRDASRSPPPKKRRRLFAPENKENENETQ